MTDSKTRRGQGLLEQMPSWYDYQANSGGRQGESRMCVYLSAVPMFGVFTKHDLQVQTSELIKLLHQEVEMRLNQWLQMDSCTSSLAYTAMDTRISNIHSTFNTSYLVRKL